MPSPLIVRKSGIHRAACLALFRALFRQINHLELIPPQKSALQSRLRKGIRDYLNEQSNPAVLAALRRGYALLKVLREDVDKPLNSPLHTDHDPATSSITGTSSPSARPLPAALPLSLLSDPPRRNITKGRSRVLQRGPRVWPHPNTSSIFDRPYPNISGRRRVPYLVITNGFPFLRIRKPQSQYLGRIIRDDVRLHTKRLDLTFKLGEYANWGRNEDDWDKILERTCGVNREDGDVKGSTSASSWSYECIQASTEVFARMTAHKKKRFDTAQRMLEIVDKEQALADKEKLERRNAKHQERKKRRFERQAAASNEPAASHEPASSEAASSETV